MMQWPTYCEDRALNDNDPQSGQFAIAISVSEVADALNRLAKSHENGEIAVMVSTALESVASAMGGVENAINTVEGRNGQSIGDSLAMMQKDFEDYKAEH